jgi:hypothetical protein
MINMDFPSGRAVAASLVAGLSLLPMAALAAKYNDIHCYGSTSMRTVTSNPFSGDDPREIRKRFERVISDRGWQVPDSIRCNADVSAEELRKIRENMRYTVGGTIVAVDVPPLSGGTSSPPASPAVAAAAPAKAETASSRYRDAAHEQTVRAAQNQMDKSVAVALADALRPKEPSRQAPERKSADRNCRIVEQRPKETRAFGKTREEALAEANGRVGSCKAVATNCFDNTITKLTKEGRPYVAGKLWDCRVSYSCGETREVCDPRAPAAASRQ